MWISMILRCHPTEGTQHSEAEPMPTRQNSRLWMSATSRTVIVRSVPNGGSRVLTAIGDRDAVLLQPDNASGLIFSAYSEG